MKRTFVIGLGFAAALALPAFAAEDAVVKPVHHHRVHRHIPRTAVPAGIVPNATALAPAASPSWIPHIAPYPNGTGDADGLSRNPDDCNKGCIGNE